MPPENVIESLRHAADPARFAVMARFGIRTDRALGVSIPDLRRIARTSNRNHELAASLWETNFHEARILAGMVDEPARVDSAQMEKWARDFDSWDLCDQVCSNLFDATVHAWSKTDAWSTRPEIFVKRAGFALMACLAVHDKAAPDWAFQGLLSLIEQESDDDRNYVLKAVNWALRQIGKRNALLRIEAIAVAERIRARGNRTARWIASDALRELNDEKVRARTESKTFGTHR